MYESSVIDIKIDKAFRRGELEITDVNKVYLKQGTLKVEFFSRGTAWLDTGTTHSLLDAANFIRVLEERQGPKNWMSREIICQKFISEGQLESLPKNRKTVDMDNTC